MVRKSEKKENKKRLSNMFGSICPTLGTQKQPACLNAGGRAGGGGDDGMGGSWGGFGRCGGSGRGGGSEGEYKEAHSSQPQQLPVPLQKDGWHLSARVLPQRGGSREQAPLHLHLTGVRGRGGGPAGGDGGGGGGPGGGGGVI